MQSYDATSCEFSSGVPNLTFLDGSEESPIEINENHYIIHNAYKKREKRIAIPEYMLKTRPEPRPVNVCFGAMLESNMQCLMWEICIVSQKITWFKVTSLISLTITNPELHSTHRFLFVLKVLKYCTITIIMNSRQYS